MKISSEIKIISLISLILLMILVSNMIAPIDAIQ